MNGCDIPDIDGTESFTYWPGLYCRAASSSTSNVIDMQDRIVPSDVVVFRHDRSVAEMSLTPFSDTNDRNRRTNTGTVLAT